MPNSLTALKRIIQEHARAATIPSRRLSEARAGVLPATRRAAIRAARDACATQGCIAIGDDLRWRR